MMRTLMVAFISGRRRLLVAVALVLAAALVVSCGNSSKAKPTPTASPEPTATALPTDAPTPTPPSVAISGFGILDGIPVTVGISTLTFVNQQHGWATNTCETRADFLFCDILVTTDGGRTWRVQYRGAGRLVRLQFLDRQTGFAFGSESGIVATTDGGATWTDVSAQPPPDLHDVEVSSADAGFALASGIIFQLDNNKRAWTFNYGSADCNFSSISFSSAEEGWAGGRGTKGPCLFGTKDGGKSWEAAIAGAQSSAVKAALDESARYGRESSNLLSQDQSCSADAPQFYGSGRARLRIVCQMGDGFTLGTTNDGKSWHYDSEQHACLMGCQTMNYQSGGGGPTFNLDLEHAWQRTGHQEISWSSDGGKTWNKVNGPELCCDTKNIFFVDANHGWITFGDSIAVTVDGGRTWKRMPVKIVP